MLCKRGLSRHAVSVRPSVTFVDCVKTNKYIFKLFPPSGRSTILVFLYQTVWQYSNGNDSAIFNDPERLATQILMSGHYLMLNISEMAKDTAIVTMEGE